MPTGPTMPAPEHEWHILQDVLGLGLLARLLGISQSSARRYLSGSRSTSDKWMNHFAPALPRTFGNGLRRRATTQRCWRGSARRQAPGHHWPRSRVPT